MSSQKKIDANSANARSGTGPKSERGKSLTRYNATKHGAFASSRLLLDEDREEYSQLSSRVYTETAPQTAIECVTVDQIIGDMWQLKRVERALVIYFEQVRRTGLLRTLKSMSEYEFEAARRIVEDSELIRSAEKDRRHDQQMLSFELATYTALGGTPPREAKPPTATGAEAPIQAAKQKLNDANDLGKRFLDGMTSPDKVSPYATLENIRRSLVRDIARKYAFLIELREQRMMIEYRPTDEA